MVEQCPICREKAVHLYPGEILLDKHCNVFSCGKCGMVFLKRGSEEKEFARQDLYWKGNAQEDIYSDRDVERAFYKTFTRYLADIESCVLGRRLLDIGCGTGIFLQVARDRGWDCCGIDISPHAVELARGRLGVPIEAGKLENGLFANERFDVVTMWDVIEHLDDPVKMLQEVYHRLNPGGLFIAETPDEEFLVRTLVKLFYRAGVGIAQFFPKYFYYQDHLFYFSLRSLSRLLQASGPFTIIKVQHLSTVWPFLKKKLHISYSHKSRYFYKVIPYLLYIASIAGVRNKILVYARKK